MVSDDVPHRSARPAPAPGPVWRRGAPGPALPSVADPGGGELVGRRRERGIIDQLVADVVAGRSRTTVLRGEAGVGKSALLGYVAHCATGCRVVTAAGVESEVELAYSGLHQLCAPLLGHLDRLPVPQGDALATVFGQRAGPAPDRLLVGIATLSLLAEVAEQQPLVCIVDDAQWLDQASAQTLRFVARRLLAERIAIVCAARTGDGDDVLDGLPDWPIHGLADSDARALLLGSVSEPLDPDVSAQIIAESRGNPLALLELPRTWASETHAGELGLPVGEPVASAIEQSYRRRLDQLPEDARLIVLTAAAEPLGDPSLLRRAVEILGIDMAAAGPAVADGLLEIDPRVTFAHPLVRSAAYRAAPVLDRRRVHRALAEATDPEVDPARRVWHRARAALGPSEEVAEELERSAGRAQAGGGVVAAAAFLRRAVALTVTPERRAPRALAAAQASLKAGAFDACRELLATAETGPLDDFQRAQVDLAKAHVVFASGELRAAPLLLLKAAQQLEPFDPELARETHLQAWAAATNAGDPDGGDLLTISRAIREIPPRAGGPETLDILLQGLALLITDGHGAAAVTLQRATKALVTLPLDDALRWGAYVSAASDAVWDNEGTHAITTRTTQLLRDVGALSQLIHPLTALGNSAMRSGDFAGAAAHMAEAETIAEAIGFRFAPFTALRLRALQGREAEADALIRGTLVLADEKGIGLAASVAHWAAAILSNGLGRYEEAARSAQLAAPQRPWVSSWVLPELIEAAVRSGDRTLAFEALEQLEGTTQPCGSDFALGIEARCRALLEVGDPDALYQEAIERLRRAGLRPDLGRAHLLYGEWLRRERRRVDARVQLRSAHDLCAEIGMEAFGERAHRELLATGEKVRPRREEVRAALSPQEEQIARLARDGLTNHEIGTVLFLSPRTVEWHLHKVFTKLGISSRRDLDTGLRREAGEGSAG